MLKDKILNMIAKDSLVYKKPSNLFCFMAKTFGVSEKTIKDEIEALITKGEIFQIKNKFIKIPSSNYVKGLFIGNAKGFGFCQVGTVKGENDIFIPAKLLTQLMVTGLLSKLAIKATKAVMVR